MSGAAVGCAFKIPGLTPSEKLTLVALADFADDRMIAWPSQATMAEHTALSERTIWASLQKLEERGLISRKKRYRPDGTRTSDVVRLNFSMVVVLDPPEKSTTRNDCGMDYSQMTHRLPATVAALTSFDPPLEDPPIDISIKSPLKVRQTDFDSFWSAYPRKVGKGSARRAFYTAWRKIRSPEALGVLMAALDRVRPTWTDPQFIPHPATWLNGERWEDEPETSTVAAHPGVGSLAPGWTPEKLEAYLASKRTAA